MFQTQHGQQIDPDHERREGGWGWGEKQRSGPREIQKWSQPGAKGLSNE